MNFYLAEVEYDQEAALAILLVNPQGDATYILAKQYITAQLNIASPADPTAIIDLLDRVKIWFNTHPIGSAPKNPDRKEGLELAAMLESYNLGQLVPGPCEVPTPTPTPTPTSTNFPPTESIDYQPWHQPSCLQQRSTTTAANPTGKPRHNTRSFIIGGICFLPSVSKHPGINDCAHSHAPNGTGIATSPIIVSVLIRWIGDVQQRIDIGVKSRA